MIPGVVAANSAFVETTAAPVFPDISARAFTSPASGTSHTLSVLGSAGERVVMVISSSAICSINTPADWNTAVYLNASGSSTVRVIWKDLDATTNYIAVTTSISVGLCALAYRIAPGTFAAAAPVATAVAGSSVNPNSPSADYGSVKNLLVLSLCGYDGFTTVTGYPLPGDNAYQTRNTSPYCGVGGCSTTFAGQVYDPGEFTLAASNPWLATTLLIAGP